MFIALEGSAPTISGGNTELNVDYKDYYVQKALGLAGDPKMYHRGPAAGSFGISMINVRKMATAATIFIAANSGKVFMVGWSRGAAACIQTAHDLKRSGGKKIDAMFLFDPVDMDSSTDDNLDFIPDSVISVYHATATQKNRWVNIFPTCGKTQASGVNAVRGYFNTSHSGIAGGPDGDAGSWRWMHTYMLKENALR
ncbi:MAG: hypothetical protein LH614_08975 [Pyrinomonadaceae bacterium]|nr:hypothetical protein [Pyrinomonadaceae bacterium]